MLNQPVTPIGPAGGKGVMEGKLGEKEKGKGDEAPP